LTTGALTRRARIRSASSRTSEETTASGVFGKAIRPQELDRQRDDDFEGDVLGLVA